MSYGPVRLMPSLLPPGARSSPCHAPLRLWRRTALISRPATGTRTRLGRAHASQRASGAILEGYVSPTRRSHLWHKKPVPKQTRWELLRSP